MFQTTIKFMTSLAITFLLGVVAIALPQQTQKPLTNADIIKMVKGELPEGTIVAAIRANPSSFDISPEALIALKRDGITQPVMDAMIASESNNRNLTAPLSTVGPRGTTALLPVQLHVELLAAAPAPGDATLQAAFSMPAEKTQLAETKTKPKSLAGLAGDSALNQGLQSGVSNVTWEAMSHTNSAAGGVAESTAGSTVAAIMSRRSSALTYVWAIPGANSSNTNVPSQAADFRVSFAGLSGVNPDEYEPAIVRLTSTRNNWRLVGATQGKESTRSSAALDWQVYSAFLEDRIPAQSRKLGPGEYQISPSGTLAPGEYGVVLRPVSREKKFSGSDVAGNLGDGLIFNSIWSFEIK